MSTDDGTKYGHLLGDRDDAPDTTDTDTDPEATLDHQVVVVTHYGATDRTLRYRVVVGHGDHDWCPIATHARRAHQLAESTQYDPMGTVEWAALPRVVKDHVADVVADVDAPADLAPTAQEVRE